MYYPREDSYFFEKFLLNYLKNTKQKIVLDMGSGSGILAKACIKAGIDKKNITSADIDLESINHIKKTLKIKTIKTDLFKNIKNKFDLILFNAPYLPEDEYDKEKDTTAGKKGYEIILKFIKQAKNHIKKDGKILLLFSNLSKPRVIIRQAKKLKFKSKKLAEKNMGFFETLFIYEFYL